MSPLRTKPIGINADTGMLPFDIDTLNADGRPARADLEAFSDLVRYRHAGLLELFSQPQRAADLPG